MTVVFEKTKQKKRIQRIKVYSESVYKIQKI